MNQKINSFCLEKSSQSQVMSGTFLEVLESVRDQIEIQCFNDRDRAQVNEICMMIAEVYKLPADAEIQIGKQKLPAAMVQEIYAMLTADHVREVITNYEKAEYIIKFKKTYIRTALYNEVFEHESRFVNGFRTYFPEFGTRDH